MKQYKIYTKGNYIVIVDVQKNEYFYGIRKEVHIDKSNVDKAVYKAFNVKDFSSSIILAVPNILKEDGTPYSEAEFDTFYQENTGNFNGGGTAPSSFADLTGSPEDNPLLLSELDSKLDKVTTVGVERAYIINADGSQGTKATSEFKDVLEFPDLASFPVTGETGKIYLALDSNKTYRWSGSAYVQIGGGGTSANKQIFHWWGGNWTTTNLNQYYYIGYNGAAIIQQNTSGGAATTISDAINGRNKGLFIAPFDCKIKRVMFKEGGSGSYTGAFVLASGLPTYGTTWNFQYNNIVTHLNQAITSAGYNQNKFEFLVTDNITVPKGYAVCPMLVFSAQAQAGKTSIEISIEIEEVV